jgi:threonyl-tRNA synthetase
MRFGREIQIPTIQLDFATPKRFGLFYIDENGEKQTPVMIHRAILGSYERFLVLLLEQFKGVLPIWLSPVQVNIIPVNNEAHYSYCKELMDKLLEEDIRVEIDSNDETLNKKIKVSNDMKNPYTLVVGDKEIKNNSVSFRKLGSREQNVMKINEFVNMIKNEIKQEKQI